MTDTSIREDERPSINSVRKVRFSYDSMKENDHDLSNEKNHQATENLRKEQGN